MHSAYLKIKDFQMFWVVFFDTRSFFRFFQRGGNCSKFEVQSDCSILVCISFNISIFWLGSYHINLWNSMVFFHFVCTDQSIEVNIYHNDMAKFSIHASKRWSKKLLYTLDGYIWLNLFCWIIKINPEFAFDTICK